jgi:hypothetical protein
MFFDMFYFDYINKMNGGALKKQLQAAISSGIFKPDKYDESVFGATDVEIMAIR